MKQSIVTLLALAAMAGNAAAATAETDYIPWTFDDFDSNCEVVDNTPEATPVVVSNVTVEAIADEEQGELGW